MKTSEDVLVRIKELRMNAGLSESEVAKKLGVSVSHYKNFEKGVGTKKLTILRGLLRLYNISSDYILGLED